MNYSRGGPGRRGQQNRPGYHRQHRQQNARGHPVPHNASYTPQTPVGTASGNPRIHNPHYRFLRGNYGYFPQGAPSHGSTSAYNQYGHSVHQSDDQYFAPQYSTATFQNRPQSSQASSSFVSYSTNQGGDPQPSISGLQNPSTGILFDRTSRGSNSIQISGSSLSMIKTSQQRLESPRKVQKTSAGSVASSSFHIPDSSDVSALLSSIPYSSSPVTSAYTVEERNLMRLISIHFHVSKKVLHRVFLMGHVDFHKQYKQSALTLYEYYKNKCVCEKMSKGGKAKACVCVEALWKQLNDKQKKKIEEDPLGFAFDVSLLYMCIQYGSDGVANIKSSKWREKDSDPCLEWYLTAVKNERNLVMHNNQNCGMKKFYEDISYLGELLKNVIQKAGDRYGLENYIIEDEIKHMFKEIHDHRDKPFVAQNLEDYKKEVPFDEFCELINTEGKIDLLAQYEQMERIIITPVNHLQDINFKVEDIFTKMVLQNESDASDKTDILLEDLLEYYTQDGKCPIYLLQGIAGVGKTTISKKILHDWMYPDESKIKHLIDYKLLLHAECRNRSINSFLSLIQALMPHISKILKAEDLRTVILSQKILVLLDGLDELNKESTKLFQEILYLKESHGISVIITTRPEKLNDILSRINRFRLKMKHMELLGIPDEKRDEFVGKYFCEMERVNTPPIKGLLFYLSRTGNRLRELWRLPYNLALLVILWVYNSKVVNTITTSAELYWEIYLLSLMKLKARLKEHYKTYYLEDSSLEEKTDAFIKTLCKEALIGLVCDNITLVDCADLVKLCSKEEIPYEELIGAFMKKVTYRTHFHEPHITYSFPHKGLQEFLGALHVFEKLSEPKGNNYGHVRVIDYLEELHGPNPVDIKKFQNLLINLIGVIYLHQNRPIKNTIIIGEPIKEEILKLIEATGITSSDSWLSIQDSVKCDDFVAKYIAQISGILDVICVEDHNVFAYVSLLSALQDFPWSEDHLDSAVELQDDAGISELLSQVARLGLPMGALSFTSEVKKIMHSVQYEDDLIQILKKNEISVYTGVLTHRMTLPGSLSYLNISVADKEAYHVLLRFLQSKNEPLDELSVRFEHSFDSSVLKPLPSLPNETQPVVEIAGVESDKAVKNACKIIRCLHPVDGERTFEKICFPKAKVSGQMIKDILFGLQGMNIRELIAFPPYSEPSDSIELSGLARELFNCKDGILWHGVYVLGRKQHRAID